MHQHLFVLDVHQCLGSYHYVESKEVSCFGQRHDVKVLDLEWLSDRCNGDLSLVSDVCIRFSDQCQSHIRAMRTAWTDADISAAAFHAEFLVGAAANVGASEMRMQAERLYDILSDKVFESQRIFVAMTMKAISICFQSCLDEIEAVQFVPRLHRQQSRNLMILLHSINLLPRRKSCSSLLRCASSGYIADRPTGNHRWGSTSLPLGGHKGDHRVNRSSTHAEAEAAFQRMRHHLDSMATHNQAGSMLSFRAEAFALSFMASGEGLWGLAEAAALAGMGGRYVERKVMDALRVRLDTMAALSQLER